MSNNKLHLSERRAAQIVSDVAAAHGVAPRDLLGPSHQRSLVTARHEAAERLYAQGASLAEVGRVLRRHHTTVLHSLRVRGVLGAGDA